ncbi:hypothetical protein EVG20_g10633 [Dentipellis fragilis]|uniref:Uncharacterized protein n=1 Tax=Dentipellis fragilis TaxID=205917 RepID=A0A4Y9XQ72_9AGAM|nr:hypothetical protein EVG20_g10633 [Dentipellis fragilis]
MQQPPAKFRVAICGGGVGGLTLAFCLSRCPDIAVDVYEATARFTEIGAGIGMWWRTWTLMKALGLDADIAALLGAAPRDERLPTLHYRKADQPEGVSFADITARGGLLTLHRAEFHHLLLTRLAASPHVHTHTSKRLHSYSSPSSSSPSSPSTPTPTPTPITLTFTDGTTAPCDILLGADGIRSAVRAQLFTDYASNTPDASALRACAHPRWSGVLAYRALVPAERLRARAPGHRIFRAPTQVRCAYMLADGLVFADADACCLVWFGAGRGSVSRERQASTSVLTTHDPGPHTAQHLMAYPISHGRYINLAAFDVAHRDSDDAPAPAPEPWVADVDPGVVQRLFGGFEREVGQLLDVRSRSRARYL